MAVVKQEDEKFEGAEAEEESYSYEKGNESKNKEKGEKEEEEVENGEIVFDRPTISGRETGIRDTNPVGMNFN